MEPKSQASTVKRRSAPPALDLHKTRRQRSSSSFSTPLTSTRTPTFRKKWPSTPTKIVGPLSDKAIHERALAGLTQEEEDRRALNALAVEKNSEIEVTGFAGSAQSRAELLKRVADRAKQAEEFDEMYSMNYDEFKEPVDIEQGNLGVYGLEEEDTKEEKVGTVESTMPK